MKAGSRAKAVAAEQFSRHVLVVKFWSAGMGAAMAVAVTVAVGVGVTYINPYNT